MKEIINTPPPIQYVDQSQITNEDIVVGKYSGHGWFMVLHDTNRPTFRILDNDGVVYNSFVNMEELVSALMPAKMYVCDSYLEAFEFMKTGVVH